jgi:hypothetical protein
VSVAGVAGIVFVAHEASVHTMVEVERDVTPQDGATSAGGNRTHSRGVQEVCTPALPPRNRGLRVLAHDLRGTFAPSVPSRCSFSRIFLFGARAIGRSRGELPRQLRLAPLCPAGRSAVENDARNVQSPPEEHGVEMWTARTSLRSVDESLQSARDEDQRGATSSASHALSSPRAAYLRTGGMPLGRRQRRAGVRAGCAVNQRLGGALGTNRFGAT